jgi:hypothetical protein
MGDNMRVRLGLGFSGLGLRVRDSNTHLKSMYKDTTKKTTKPSHGTKSSAIAMQREESKCATVTIHHTSLSLQRKCTGRCCSRAFVTSQKTSHPLVRSQAQGIHLHEKKRGRVGPDGLG